MWHARSVLEGVAFLYCACALRSDWISLSDIVPGRKESMTEEKSPEMIIIKGKRNVFQHLEWCLCIV